MTPQSALRVDFKEIKEIRITCAECSAEIVIPITRKIIRALDCPGCNKRLWDDGQQGNVFRAVARIQESLQIGADCNTRGLRSGLICHVSLV